MNRKRRTFWNAISVLVLVALWWIGSVLFSGVIPGLSDTLEASIEVLTTPGPYGYPFHYHLIETLKMIIASIGLSLLLGTVFGIALGTNEKIENAVSTWIYAWLAIPSLVIVFVAGIWLGFDETAGYFAVPIVIMPFVVLNMWEGARNLDSELEEMANFFGVSYRQRFTGLIIPQLLPSLFASIRSALSIGWKITLLVEAFLLTRGVGFMFKWYFDQYNLTKMTSWLLIFVAFLVIVEYGIIVPLRNRVTHWQPSAGGAVQATE